MPTSTLTPEQIAELHEMLSIEKHPHLARGLGTVEEPCTLAAINLALSGRLVDEIPSCMSLPIGRFLVSIQGSCPPELGRDHPRWRAAVVLCAGTGRKPAAEAARVRLLLEWLWAKVLPIRQVQADASGFGVEWAAMCAAFGEVGPALAARAAAARSEQVAFELSSAQAWARMDVVSVVEALAAT